VKRLAAVGAVLVLAAALASCASGSGSSGRLTATADFADINALEHHATVELNGVNVGVVSHIGLDGTLAHLTLSLKRSAHIPADVVAQVKQDSLLGPDVVDLVVPADSHAPLLADHAVIADASHPGKFQPNFETLVKAGNDLLGTLGAAGISALARVVNEGAKGFGPEGGDLRIVLTDLNTTVTGYATRTQAITTLLQNLDTFSTTLAPNAQANAQALANLATATAELDRQKDRLVSLLSALGSVAQQGASLLNADLGLITDQFTGLNSITKALANQQVALGSLLVNLYGHNLALSRGVSHPDDFVQVLNDFIVCGLPGHAGGDIPGDPVNSCYDAGNGTP
jgi:phospholipid/cholesterol/gamma-HCH transport system substrate-binding protein